MNTLLIRLKSKTYLAAIIGALITVVDANSGVISQMLPPSFQGYAVLLWPALMMALREVTTTKL